MRLISKLRTYKWVEREYSSGDHYAPIYYTEKIREHTTNFRGADLIGSKVNFTEGKHMLLLDLDRRVELYASKTQGHNHLVVDARMSWREYKRIIKALAKGRVIEQSWAKTVLKDRQAFLSMEGKE